MAREIVIDLHNQPAAPPRSRRRVGVIIEKLPGFGFGGAQAVGFWTVQALQEIHQVTILTATHDLSLAEANAFFGTTVRPERVEVVVAPVPTPIRRNPRLKLLASQLIGHYCRQVSSDYDLLISTGGEMDLGGSGIQYIHYPQVLSRGRSRRNLAFGSFSRFITGFSQARMACNSTLTNSQWTAERAREAYGIEARVVYPPVPDDMEPQCLPWARREDGFVCVGRIAAEKSLERVIRIVKRVRERLPHVHLHIVGGGRNRRYSGKIEDLAAEEEEWLFFEGKLPRDGMVKLIGAHKYGIHGMREEHFGIGIAEMAKAGCVVFVPRGGGQVEIVQAEDLVYDSEADAAVKILSVVASHERQMALRAALTARAREFSSERFIQEMRNAVEMFLAERDVARA